MPVNVNPAHVVHICIKGKENLQKRPLQVMFSKKQVFTKISTVFGKAQYKFFKKQGNVIIVKDNKQDFS